MKILLPFFNRALFPVKTLSIGSTHTNTNLYVIGICDFPHLHSMSSLQNITFTFNNMLISLYGFKYCCFQAIVHG